MKERPPTSDQATAWGVAAGAGPREPLLGEAQRRLRLAHQAADLAAVDPADDPRVLTVGRERRVGQAIGEG
jgi:hypothetical protein